MQYPVAGYELWLPDDHLLPKYQATWHLYDRFLGHLAQAIAAKYPAMTAIDIGANIGDTAALIQEFCAIPTLCIEGNPEYIEYLNKNDEVIGHIEIVDCFIGDDNSSVALDQIRSGGGTASILQAVNAEGLFQIPMLSLETVLSHFPQYAQAKLLKIDTDGFDFYILRKSEKFIREVQPILYFEYDIVLSENGFKDGLEIINYIRESGYQKMIIFDNFGNQMMRLDLHDFDYFYDLNNYLYSNRVYSGTPAVYHYDICAFSGVDLDVYQALFRSPRHSGSHPPPKEQ